MTGLSGTNLVARVSQPVPLGRTLGPSSSVKDKRGRRLLTIDKSVEDVLAVLLDQIINVTKDAAEVTRQRWPFVAVRRHGRERCKMTKAQVLWLPCNFSSDEEQRRGKKYWLTTWSNAVVVVIRPRTR